jgi:hypothetical protein
MGPDSCTPDCRQIQRSKARRVASSDGACEVVTSRLETLLQPRATGTPPAMPLSFVCALEFFIYSRAFQPLVSCHHWPASTSPTSTPPPPPPFPRPSSFILPEHLRLSTSILTLHSLSAGPAQGSSLGARPSAIRNAVTGAATRVRTLARVYGLDARAVKWLDKRTAPAWQSASQGSRVRLPSGREGGREGGGGIGDSGGCSGPGNLPPQAAKSLREQRRRRPAGWRAAFAPGAAASEEGRGG